MIYKLQTGGIIKLQNAGSVPQIDNTRVSKPLMEYQKSTAEQDHDALVKWNLEHPNDKVYRIEDLIQKEKEANPSWVKKIADTKIEVPVTTPAVGWNGTSFYSQVPKVKSTVGKELGYTMGLLTAPALLSEFGTYGLIGGGLRLGAGSAAAAGASYAGGKAGDWLDDKLGANWIGDTNRLVLPFITFPAGMKGAGSALRSAAGHGITMGMPQETFNVLRSSYFTNRFNKINHLKIIPNKGWDNFSNLDVYKDTFYNHPAIETTEPVTDVPNIPGIKVGNPKDIAKLRVSPSSAMETGYIDFFDESKPFRRDLRKVYDIVRDGTSYHFGHPLEEGVVYRTRDGYEFLEYPRGSNTRYYTGKIKTEGYTPTLVHEGEPNMKGTMQLPRPDPFKRNSEDYLWWQRNSPWVRHTKGKTVRINDAIPTKAAWGSDHTSPIRLSGPFDLSDPNLNAAMMEYNPLTKTWARVKYQFPKVRVSEPYARLSRDGKIINEARSFSIDDDPFNTFQLIKDIEPHQYSVHFKTLGRHVLSEPQKQMLFQAVADAIPGGSKLSTWGSVSKGGLAGLKRFEGLGFKPSLQTRTLGLKAQPTQGETLPFGEIVGDKVEVPILYKPKDVVAGSRPISEAELKGWPKQFRNQRRRQISASEYSGLPKGERNNGRYGDIRFIRHMDAVPELTEDGFVQIAPKENWLANFTTDRIMTPHKGYQKQAIGKNVLIISPEAFRGTTPFSLDPGDSFFINSELKIKPKHITFISGDKQALQLAKERGFNTESSPKLKILSKFINPATWEEQQLMRPELEKRGYWFHGRQYPKIKSDYIDELTRILQTRFNRPSLKDYSNIESVTGVPTHTYSRQNAPWNSFIGPKTGYRGVIYDTVPETEYNLMEQIGSYAHPMARSMEGYSPIFFRIWNGWTPIKKQGGIIKG